MNLPEEDVDQFYRQYHSLLFYVNTYFNIIESLKNPDDIFRASLEKIAELKERLYAQPELIDAFVSDNPMGFSAQDLEIIRSWKNFVTGKFVIMSYQKNYAVFLDTKTPPKAYGVLALRSSFEEMLGSEVPISVQLTLLPYKDRIIYDGTIARDRLIYGPNIRKDLKLLLDEAKELIGIITQLPFQPNAVEPTDLDKLKLYLKNRQSRDAYFYEIHELIEKDPGLMAYYSQTMGKVESSALKRKLKVAGVKKGWFAILDGMIIASGRSRDEVSTILDAIMDNDKKDHVYVFNIK
jgi:hypothetical protein